MVKHKNINAATPGSNAINAKHASIWHKYHVNPLILDHAPTRPDKRAATIQSAHPCGIPNTNNAITNGHGAAVVVNAGSINALNTPNASTHHGHARASAKINRPAFTTCSTDLCDPSNSAAVGGASFKLNMSNDSGFVSQSLHALVADQAEENFVDDVGHVVQNFAPAFTIAAIESHQETDWVNHPTHQHEQAHGL